MQAFENGTVNLYALRIEGREWLDDLTIEQVWEVLKAAYQALDPRRDLLFMTLLPNGEMPAKCLPRSVFESSLQTPGMLAEALWGLGAPLET